VRSGSKGKGTDLSKAVQQVCTERTPSTTAARLRWLQQQLPCGSNSRAYSRPTPSGTQWHLAAADTLLNNRFPKQMSTLCVSCASLTAARCRVKTYSSLQHARDQRLPLCMSGRFTLLGSTRIKHVAFKNVFNGTPSPSSQQYLHLTGLCAML
jgi:hypothetical protein